MSMGSSPFAFAEFANATLRLPDSLREYLRWPMGALVQGPSILPTIGRANPVVTVGDFCTLDLVARGRTPDICVVDFKTKRQEDPELREALQRIGSKALRVTNPSAGAPPATPRSEEHTSELQSRQYLVCRLLLEKKKNKKHK